MDKKNILIPAILAIAAATIYLMILTAKERSLMSAYETTHVLVARLDIPERTVLKENMVEALSIPRKFMQQDAFEVNSPSDISLISNLVTRVRIPRGDQVTQSSLISISAKAGLSVKIPPGYRGAILPINPAMRDLIKPGDHVDVLVTFSAKMADGHKEKVTATILQNLMVLAVGDNMGQGLNAKQAKALNSQQSQLASLSDKAAVSVALNPDEAQYLALSMKEGSVEVILRGLGDLEMHPMSMASFRKLFK